MKWTEKNRLATLMALHLLWGLVLWFSISKVGLGVSTDSVHLLFGGLNLSEGKGLVSFDGSFLLLWPPLYPILLAFVHLVSGMDVFAAANLLQFFSLIGLSFCLSLLFLRIFPENFLLALAGNLLSDIGVVVLTTFTVVGSDYVHLFLVVLFLLLAGYYLEYKTPRAFLGMSAVGLLAMLQRYTGIAAIATGAAVVFFFTSGALWQRMVRSVWLSLSALPAGVWLVVTSKLSDRRDPISFAENFEWFSKSILEWFFLAGAVKAHLAFYIVVLWIFVIGLIVLLSSFPARREVFSSFTVPVFVFGLFYGLTLFGSASITYFNKLGERFLLPLYVPFVALMVVSVGVLLKYAKRLRFPTIRRAVYFMLIGAPAVVAALLASITLPIVLESHAHGAAGGENVFNTVAWHENTALRYWLDHKPQREYLLFSNYPDGVAFHTRHACEAAPRKYSGPYGKEGFPVSGYASELFSSGLDVYVIWIKPNAYDYYYGMDELSPIAQVEPLFTSADGGVYRLEAK